VVEKERLQMRARRMCRRQVERVEVVVRRLHLAPVHDPVPEPEDDVLDLAADLTHEVELAARRCPPGKRDVDLLFDETPLQLRSREPGLTLRDRLVELLAQRGEGAG